MHTASRNICNLIVILQFLLLLPFTNPSQPLLGIHLLDEKYYASEVIKCRDGSKTFSKDRLNDDFCDCVDGTDEPGTSACPRGKFYCRNVGSIPQFLFSSRVNDQICVKPPIVTLSFYQFKLWLGSYNAGVDFIYSSCNLSSHSIYCCDGSDEYGSGISCPNICVMGGNLEYTAGNIERNAGSYKSFIGEKESKIALQDLLQKTTGLKIAIIIQIALLGYTIAFRVCRRIRLKRRRLI